LGLAAARRELDAVERRPPEYARWIVVAALGLSAASLSRLFGGDWPTFAAAWLAGAARRRTRCSPRWRRSATRFCSMSRRA
jgi:uncharacterized membrane protein YjjP (DUF1212 family)